MGVGFGQVELDPLAAATFHDTISAQFDKFVNGKVRWRGAARNTLRAAHNQAPQA
jgi:hypothetical protein